MPLASFTFLYLFLPVSLAVYYLFPQRMRYGVLLGISLVFFLFLFTNAIFYYKLYKLIFFVTMKNNTVF